MVRFLYKLKLVERMLKVVKGISIGFFISISFWIIFAVTVYAMFR